MCGSLNDHDAFLDLLSGSDDEFDLSASVLGPLSNSRTRSTLQSAKQSALHFQLGHATHDELDDNMLNTDDVDTGGYPQIKCKWNCGPSISELRSRANDAPATVALEQDTTLCVGHGKAVGLLSASEIIFSSHIYTRWALRQTPVQRIEDLVVDFLEQLSAALPSTEEEVKDVLRGKFKNPRKLKLKLTDRRKLSTDGYAVPQCLCLPSHGNRTFGTRTQAFPKGVCGSIIRFGKASNLTLRSNLI